VARACAQMCTACSTCWTRSTATAARCGRRPSRPCSSHSSQDHEAGHRSGDGSITRCAPEPNSAILDTRTCWLDHHGELPIIEGTLTALRSSTCPATATPSRCGCGPRPPVPPPPTSTGSGRRSRAASTWSTPSGCSSRPWAGPAPSSTPPGRRPLDPAGHRLPHPAPLGPSPADDLRRPWERPAPQGGSPRPGSAAGFGTSAPRPPCQPAHQNPASQAPDAHPGPTTTGPRRTTRSARPANETSRSQPDNNERVKRQAELGVY
jgi:hypothetical protein